MPFQALYKNTFGENGALEKVISEHPYFSAAHFFMLQQTNEQAANYNEVAAKAALHFANPYLLHHQLTLKKEEAVAAVTELPTLKKEAVHSITEEIVEEQLVVEEPVNMASEIAAPAVEAKVETEPVKETVVEPVVAKPTSNEPLLFEPLHTTDYFASQGIKLSEQVLTGDKVGRQLKSFTEWLKTMKKVHPEGKDKSGGDGFIDPSVQKLAEKSNQEEDIITESMAEVFLQQGKTNKAKEIYEKLSLLNPSKSAYFAAKLNEIQ